jgi:tetratricopeptide (TPR) repeat protein
MLNAQRCPEPSLIAAYVDGNLDIEGRRAFERHMADCAECPVVVGETARFVMEMHPRESRPRARRRVRRWIALAASLAILPLAWLLVSERPMDEVREIAARAPTREVEGRLEGFAHQRFTGTRSATARQDNLALRAVANRLSRERNPDAIRARATALLLNGDAAEAVRLLSSLAVSHPDAPTWNDLAVAQLANAATRGRSTIEHALRSTERAIVLDSSSAEGHFNRAVALEHLGRYEDAAAAYNRALELESGPAWRAEIAGRIAHLTAR